MSVFKWINVGKVFVEWDDEFVNYFYDNGVLNLVFINKLLFLVLGRKGVGKIVVFRYLKENFY